MVKRARPELEPRRPPGRPRVRHERLLALVGPAPDDPLALPGWFQRLVAIDTVERLEGRGSRQRSQEIRAAARAAAAGVPRERLYQAEQTILRSERRAEEAHGPPVTD